MEPLIPLIIIVVALTLKYGIIAGNVLVWKHDRGFWGACVRLVLFSLGTVVAVCLFVRHVDMSRSVEVDGTGAWIVLPGEASLERYNLWVANTSSAVLLALINLFSLFSILLSEFDSAGPSKSSPVKHQLAHRLLALAVLAMLIPVLLAPILGLRTWYPSEAGFTQTTPSFPAGLECPSLCSGGYNGSFVQCDLYDVKQVRLFEVDGFCTLPSDLGCLEAEYSRSPAGYESSALDSVSQLMDMLLSEELVGELRVRDADAQLNADPELSYTGRPLFAAFISTFIIYLVLDYATYLVVALFVVVSHCCKCCSVVASYSSTFEPRFHVFRAVACLALLVWVTVAVQRAKTEEVYSTCVWLGEPFDSTVVFSGAWEVQTRRILLGFWFVAADLVSIGLQRPLFD